MTFFILIKKMPMVSIYISCLVGDFPQGFFDRNNINLVHQGSYDELPVLYSVPFQLLTPQINLNLLIGSPPLPTDVINVNKLFLDMPSPTHTCFGLTQDSAQRYMWPLHAPSQSPLHQLHTTGQHYSNHATTLCKCGFATHTGKSEFKYFM